MRRPLYGHESPSTAYVVADYPYGYRLRTSIRYWLEWSGRHGTRLVSQTLHPKTGTWNKPKASTYAKWGAMYLDESTGHVEWSGLGPHSSAAAAIAFVGTFKHFHGADELRAFAMARAHTLRQFIRGERWFTVNGTRAARSEADDTRDAVEAAIWEVVAARLA